MTYLDIFRYCFICVSIFLVVILDLLMFFAFRKDNAYKKYIIRTICLGISAIITYSLFLLSKTHTWAVFFDSLFFIETDWLALCILIFAVDYTGAGKKYQKFFTIFFSAGCAADSLNLLINNFTHHMFNLVEMNSWYALAYWGNDFKFMHYLHLAFCYVMVLLTFLYLIIGIRTAPKICKMKYISIFCAYIVVISANCICYSFNLPFDISVVFYGLLGGFLCYFSTYSYPQRMLAISLKAVNDTISDAIMYFDAKDRCIYHNRKAKVLFENDGVFEPFLADAYREKWDSKLNDDEQVVTGEDSFRCNGRELHFSVEYRREYYGLQRIGSYIRIMDITENYVNFRKERFVATHDTFTGLLNRTGFFEAVEEMIEEKGTFGYVMLTSNIRDFKLINDTFGEDMGDEIILKQAGLLKTFSHPSSIFARICDDKFALYTRREHFHEKEFCEYMKLMHNVMDRPLYQMRVVVGVYQPQGRVETAQSMYDKALLATTQITTRYNEIFAYYDTILMDKLLNEKTIREDFAGAIANGQIEMYLQPIMDADKKICGAEALTRWNHPTRGFLLPGEFITILEKSGMIYDLDVYIWENAAKLVRKWVDEGITDAFISVNVSVKDFFYTDIYKTFTRLVEDYDILPSSIHIEITESVLMSDFARAHTLAIKLIKEGFTVAIDNFGNGFSSLNMMKDFVASELKIGMSLLEKGVEKNRNQIILESIVDMAESIGITVISEGVETEDRFELLKKCHCKYFQGNYLAAPMTVSEYEELIKSSK